MSSTAGRLRELEEELSETRSAKEAGDAELVATGATIAEVCNLIYLKRLDLYNLHPADLQSYDITHLQPWS